MGSSFAPRHEAHSVAHESLCHISIETCRYAKVYRDPEIWRISSYLATCLHEGGSRVTDTALSAATLPLCAVALLHSYLPIRACTFNLPQAGVPKFASVRVSEPGS